VKLGGYMRLLYACWKHTGGRMCPFRTHHVLGEDYRRLDDPDAPPVRPSDPRRVRNILLAFAACAEEEQIDLAAAQTASI